MNTGYCGMDMYAALVTEKESVIQCLKCGRVERQSVQQKLKGRIDAILVELRQLQIIIANCDKIINMVKGHDLQTIYAQETLPLIDDYNFLLKELSELLEEYFKWERDNKKPSSFKYHKLHKNIVDHEEYLRKWLNEE